MDNPGLVRDELDRKILILYVLRFVHHFSF